eukprot:10937544-Karenia_brevis.AAC.1
MWNNKLPTGARVQSSVQFKKGQDAQTQQQKNADFAMGMANLQRQMVASKEWLVENSPKLTPD